METACLRIKFSPLLQDARKSQSKCCLEIVPQVSYVKNLDKLTWKQESNLIEYIIPMTYKIILRKLQENCSNDEILKTYHSCVDLLMSSSTSNFDVDFSGDASRIISDTLIINKLQSTIQKEDFINLSPGELKSSEITKSGLETGDTVLEEFDLSINEIQEKVITDDDSALKRGLDNLNSIKNTFSDKFTDTDSQLLTLTNDVLPDWSVKFTNKFESKRMLTVSPICSINTQENTFSFPRQSITKQNYISNAITSENSSNAKFRQNISNAITHKTDYFSKDLVPLTCMSESTNCGRISNIISPDESGQNSIKSVRFTSSDRSPPEIRIAQYMRYMEKELTPLKLSLNDLISKCVVLGLYQDSTKCVNPSNKKLLLYKSVCMYNNHITTETCEKVVSNRAVYTIVFDG